MLISLVLELAPARTCPTGNDVHRWFFREVVGPRDAALATRLHDGSRSKARDGAKPLAIGILPKKRRRREGVDELCSSVLRVSSTDPALSQLLAALRPQEMRSLALESGRYEVRGLHARPADHPLAASSSMEALWREASVEGLPGRVRLRFLSSTAFDHDVTRPDGTKERRNELFPRPTQVFRSLIAAWNATCPATSGRGTVPAVTDEVRDDLLRRVREEEYELETVPPLKLGKFTEKGFLGECEYSVGRGASTTVARTLHALALFAFFSGVGMRTHMGMGQVICVRG